MANPEDYKMTIGDVADAAVTAIIFAMFYYLIVKIVCIPFRITFWFLWKLGLKGIAFFGIVGYLVYRNFDAIAPYLVKAAEKAAPYIERMLAQ